MTRKELVREIDHILAEYDYRLDSIEKEALCKAREALEQEPCDDCIWFRQGVQRTRMESDGE